MMGGDAQNRVRSASTEEARLVVQKPSRILADARLFEGDARTRHRDDRSGSHTHARSPVLRPNLRSFALSLAHWTRRSAIAVPDRAMLKFNHLREGSSRLWTKCPD